MCICLLGIIANLLSMGRFFDIALRDLGLSVSAFSLAQLSTSPTHVPSVICGRKTGHATSILALGTVSAADSLFIHGGCRCVKAHAALPKQEPSDKHVVHARIGNGAGESQGGMLD